MPHPLDPRLIVALDLPDVDAAAALVARLGDAVAAYKVGLELASSPGGMAYAERLVGEGFRVFLDMKLHDIGTTVERAAANAARMGVALLTVHAFPQTMRAAAAGVAGSGTTVLGVTVLTSYDDRDMEESGSAFGVAETVRRRALQARDAGIGGLVMSAAEVAEVRALVGDGMRLVVPGIRPEGAEAGDQKRSATPAAALGAGADFLVVGRPVTRAPDPRSAAVAIVADMARVPGREVDA